MRRSAGSEDLFACFSCQAEPEDIDFTETHYVDDWEEPGFDVQMKHKRIFCAIENGNLENTKKLFEKNEFKIEETAPFIQAAAFYGHKNIIEYFLHKGASTNELCLSIKEKYDPRTTYIDMEFEKRLVPLGLVAANAPDDSGIIKFLIERGLNLEIIGNSNHLAKLVYLRKKPQAIDFLLKKAGTYKKIPLLAPEYQRSAKNLKEMREKNKTALEAYDKNPEKPESTLKFLESDAFAFRKFKALERLVKNRKKTEQQLDPISWQKLFQNVLFCQAFFTNQSAARFANTKNLQDSNGQTILGVMLKSKDILMENPQFISTVLKEVGYEHRTNFDQFCERIYTDDQPNPENEEPRLAHLLKTKAMAKRMHSQAEKYELKQENLAIVKNKTEKFLRDLKNTTYVADLIYNSLHQLPIECLLHCISYTDGNFGKEEMRVPLTTKIINSLKKITPSIKKVSSERCIIS